MASRDDIVAYGDVRLDAANYDDYCPNLIAYHDKIETRFFDDPNPK